MKGILGRKLGMTQVFAEDGTMIPVTVVEVQPNVVLQKKTVETDNYDAVQLGVVDVKLHRSNKSEIAHAAKANTAPKKFVREIAGNDMHNLEVGDAVKADLFNAGDFVDVTGISRGKGFQGAIRRNNQKLGFMSHGSRFHRGLGSLATGGTASSNIKPGTTAAGQMGVKTRTNQNLEVIKIDTENNYMLVKGNIPGPSRGFVVVKETTKRVKSKDPVVLIDYSKEDSDNA